MPASKTSGSGLLPAALGLFGLSGLAGLLVAVMVAPAVAVTGVVANSTVAIFDGLPTTLTPPKLAEPSTLYASNGKDSDGKTKWVPFAQFYDKNRIVVSREQISQATIDATIAAEDERFYQHNGVDLAGLARAAVTNIASSSTAEGASTITMQLVRNILREIAEDSNDKKLLEEYNAITIERKLQEIKYAVSLEQQSTKDQIITDYLNIAIFGGQVYGIEAAAHRYFNKKAIDLTAGEAASLIAIVQLPTAHRLDLPNSEQNGEANGYKLNKSRRDTTLNIMHKMGNLSKEQLDAELAKPVTPDIQPIPNGCQYSQVDGKKIAGTFCDYVAYEFRQNPAFGTDPAVRWKSLQSGGYHIYTTLDLRLQKKAEQSLRQNAKPNWRGIDLGAVAASVEVGTGRILVMAQNKPYDATEAAAKSKKATSINYAADQKYGGSTGFQTGSTFKAFTLVTWLAANRALSEHVNGSVRKFKMTEFYDSCSGVGGPDWPVKNAGGSADSMTVLQATVSSVNTAFVDMATELDLCQIRKNAEAMGAHRADGYPLRAGPSMVIGSDEVAPLNMAVAYAAIANRGVTCTPVAIDEITRMDGQSIPVEPTVCTRVLTEDVANAAVYAMKAVISGGTGSASNPGDGVPVFGKTGTTDLTDQTWMMASTKKVSTAVWVGNVQGKKRLHHYIGPNGRYLNTARHAVMKSLLQKINSYGQYRGGNWSAPPGALVGGQRIQVPDTLIGMQEGEARELLEALGFNVKIGKRITSNMPAGLVAAVSPGVGSSQPRGRMIQLRLSDGQGIGIPPTTGLTQAAAESALQSAGFTGPFTIVQQHHDTIAVGLVIRTNPSEGRFAKAGATIRIYVSLGPAPIPPLPSP